MKSNGDHTTDEQVGIERSAKPVRTLVPWETSLTFALRLKFALTGILFPAGCFALIATGEYVSWDSPWQSGRLEHHVAVLLSAPPVFAFLPLIVGSMLALSVWCYDPWEMSRRLWVRIGLYGGGILTAMFSLLLLVCTALASPVAALVIGPIQAGLVWAVGQFVGARQFSIGRLMLLTACIALLLGLVLAVSPDSQSRVAAAWSCVIGIIIAAPTLATVTYLRVSFAARDLASDESPASDSQSSSNWRSPLGWLTWLAGYAASWKVALELEAIEYAKLPTSNPNCYVCSAAAYGHPVWVGSKMREDGHRVNLQMRRLKLLELALRVAHPRLHRVLRKTYNWIGPRLARICGRNQWCADLTYLLLKPAEWSALGLQSCLRISAEVVGSLY